MAQFSISFSCNTGDLIDVWGHSPGVTTEDYENDPSIDPYYIHDSYTMSDTEPHWYWFLYDETRGYVAAVYVNGVLAERKTIDPIVIPNVKIDKVVTDYTSITIYFSNTNSGDNLRVCYYVDETTIHDASISYYQDGTARAQFNGLTSDKNYAIYVYADDVMIDKLYYSTNAYPEFQWSTTIERGAEMALNWNAKEVSPITAEEWNRFLDIYSLKKNITYPHVSKGDEFSVVNGATPKKIADDLGVGVAVGTEITAQFYIDLMNALNALK